MHLASPALSERRYISDLHLLDKHMHSEKPSKKETKFQNMEASFEPHELVAPQASMSHILSSLVRGKYQYITHLFSSAASTYLWLAPNYQKLQLLRPLQKSLARHQNENNVQIF